MDVNAADESTGLWKTCGRTVHLLLNVAAPNFFVATFGRETVRRDHWTELSFIASLDRGEETRKMRLVPQKTFWP